MPAKYKQKCSACKKNYVIATYRDRYPVCYDCQREELSSEIRDSSMKKLFDIPEELYRKSIFLRDIKLNYIRYGKLSERQIDAFKKTAAKLREQKD